MTGQGPPSYARKEVSNKRRRPGDDQQRRRIRPSHFKTQQHVRNADAKVQQTLGGGLHPRDLGILGGGPEGTLARSRNPWRRDGGVPYPNAQLRRTGSLQGWPGTVYLREIGVVDEGGAPFFVEQEQVLPQAFPTHQRNYREYRDGQPEFHSKEKGLLGRAPGEGGIRSERTLERNTRDRGGRVRSWEKRSHGVGSQPVEYGILGGAPGQPLVVDHGVSISNGTAMVWEQGLLGKGPMSETLPRLPQGRVLMERFERHPDDHKPSLRASDVMLQSHNALRTVDSEHNLSAPRGIFRDPQYERVVGGRQLRHAGMSDMTFRAQSNGRSRRGSAPYRGLLGRVPFVTDLGAA